MKLLTEEEINEELESAVKDGHLFKDENGKYGLTEKSLHIQTLNAVLNLLDHRHDYAFTFCAIQFVTGLPHRSIVQALVQLIRDKVISRGNVEGKRNRKTAIYHICEQQKGLRLYCAPKEVPGDNQSKRYDEDIKIGLKNAKMLH